jgi:hypothetical protein
MCNVVSPCSCDHGKLAAAKDMRPVVHQDRNDVPTENDKAVAFMAIASIREGLEARRAARGQ